MKTTEHAIIVAGGKGTRLKSAVPKQFLELNGLPVLMHTINAFYRYAPDINVILVLPERDLDTWTALCKQYQFNQKVLIQTGGDTRFQSVRNGLKLIDNAEGLVAIHDGVRPLIHEDIIGASQSD